MLRLGYGRGYDIGVFGSVFGHNVTQNLPVLAIQSMQPARNFDSVFNLSQGPPALDPATILAAQPKGPNGRPLLPNGVTAFILPKKLRLPTNDAWNFTIQHQLPGDMSVEAAYIGNKGTHVFAGNGGDYDFNQARIEGFGTLTTNQRKPFFQKFGWSQNFRYYGSDASNNYHALQLKAEKRFSRGYSLLGHYTFSRVLQLHEHLLQHRSGPGLWSERQPPHDMCSACTACGSCPSGSAGNISATPAGSSTHSSAAGR